MTDDIVKRLRLSADAYERASFKTQAAQLREAADRIEALEGALRDIIGMPQIAGDVAADSMRIIAERGLKRRTK